MAFNFQAAKVETATARTLKSFSEFAQVRLSFAVAALYRCKPDAHTHTH